MNRFQNLLLLSGVAVSFGISLAPARAATNVIEKQLAEIGTIPNDEVVVVQRKYTRKNMRHELTPIGFGGLPFGTIRRTLMGSASYTLHFNDWFAWEAFSFAYTKNFFSGFTGDINTHVNGGGDCSAAGSTQACIKPDYQKLLFFMTTGVQFAPFYGKIASFSRYIAYIEPYLSLGVGMAKTESSSYLAGVPGVGLRVFFKEWFSMKVEFKDYIYNEAGVTRSATPTTQNNLRNNYAVMASLSFWLPKM